MFQRKRKIVLRKFIKKDKIQLQHMRAIKFTFAQVNDSFIQIIYIRFKDDIKEKTQPFLGPFNSLRFPPSYANVAVGAKYHPTTLV